MPILMTAGAALAGGHEDCGYQQIRAGGSNGRAGGPRHHPRARVHRSNTQRDTHLIVMVNDDGGDGGVGAANQAAHLGAGAGVGWSHATPVDLADTRRQCSPLGRQPKTPSEAAAAPGKLALAPIPMHAPAFANSTRCPRSCAGRTNASSSRISCILRSSSRWGASGNGRVAP